MIGRWLVERFRRTKRTSPVPPTPAEANDLDEFDRRQDEQRRRLNDQARERLLKQDDVHRDLISAARARSYTEAQAELWRRGGE